jgi:hypothetical protein
MENINQPALLLGIHWYKTFWVIQADNIMLMPDGMAEGNIGVKLI